MAQVKIYAHKEALDKSRQNLSNSIHSCLVDAFKLPKDKRFHRFIALDKEDFIHPNDRSENYCIIEIIMFEGRSQKVKKDLIGLLYKRLELLGIAAQDLELVMLESPRQNWGIRGVSADELSLTYKVNPE